jgi:hypothetical protein
MSHLSTLRADQESALSRAADALRTISDDELSQVTRALFGVLADWPKDVFGSRGGELVRALTDLPLGESEHRRVSYWNIEAELNGGHHTIVSLDENEIGKWQAYCAPVLESNDSCWNGPNRATREEAIEDAHRHASHIEPECFPPFEDA